MNLPPIVYRHARPEFLTVRAFADHFGVSKMTIYRLIDEGFINANRIGKSIRIPVAELKRYKKATAVGPGDTYAEGFQP